MHVVRDFGFDFVASRNIVATVNLDCRLDLKTIALHARNAEYNPKVNIHTFLGADLSSFEPIVDLYFPPP